MTKAILDCTFNDFSIVVKKLMSHEIGIDSFRILDRLVPKAVFLISDLNMVQPSQEEVFIVNYIRRRNPVTKKKGATEGENDSKEAKEKVLLSVPEFWNPPSLSKEGVRTFLSDFGGRKKRASLEVIRDGPIEVMKIWVVERRTMAMRT